MPLTNVKLRALRAGDRPFKVSDAAGLFILVSPSGSKLWRLAYRYDGKHKLLAFGAYPDVSLRDASPQTMQSSVCMIVRLRPEPPCWLADL